MRRSPQKRGEGLELLGTSPGCSIWILTTSASLPEVLTPSWWSQWAEHGLAPPDRVEAVVDRDSPEPIHLTLCVDALEEIGLPIPRVSVLTHYARVTSGPTARLTLSVRDDTAASCN
jgi:hypothetical protein